MSLPKKIALACASAGAFYAGMYLLFSSHLVAIVLTASVAFHEGAHALVLYLNGYPSKMVFVPFVGAGVIPDDSKHFAKRAHWHLHSWVALVGPVVNVAFVFVGIALSWLPGWDREGKMVASANALLAAWNLLPFAIFDGGRFIHAVFKSMREEADQAIQWGVGAIALIVGLAMIWRGQVALLPLLVFLAIHFEAGKDKPKDASSTKAMTVEQAVWATGLYSFCLATSLVSYWLLPQFTDLA